MTLALPLLLLLLLLLLLRSGVPPRALDGAGELKRIDESLSRAFVKTERAAAIAQR